MSFGAIFPTTPCRTIARGGNPARLPPLLTCSSARSSALSTSWPSLYIARSPPTLSCSRGKRTTTKSKLKQLPQGRVSAMLDANDSTQHPPEKVHSRTLQQHLDNMRKYPDCVILTRVGDFYELYFDQVQQYAPLVNLKQARKGGVPMAGFQYTQLGRYLRMFVKDLGKQVAISEQVAPSVDEASSSNLKFDRKVTRIVSAGTLIDEDFLDPNESNYLLAVDVDGSSMGRDFGPAAHVSFKTTSVGLSWVDLSSGEFFTQACNASSLPSLLAGIRPSEVILGDNLQCYDEAQLHSFLGEGNYTLHFHPTAPNASLHPPLDRWATMLERTISPSEQKHFTLTEFYAMDMLLSFVDSKLLDSTVKLQPPVRKTDEEYMTIDRQSIRGLEIRNTLRDARFEGSLLHAVRRTVTNSGTRLLTRRLMGPSLSLPVIHARLDLVQEFLQHDALREDVVALLRKSSDVSRLLQRCSANRADADDVLALAETVEALDRLVVRLREHASDSAMNGTGACLQDVLGRFDLDEPRKIAKAINEAIDRESLERAHIDDDVAAAIDEEKPSDPAKRVSTDNGASADANADEEIWIMRRTASPPLRVAHNNLAELAEKRQILLQQLRKQLKSANLTFKWTAQYGHYCHVKITKANPCNLDALQGVRSISSTKTSRTFYLLEWTDLAVFLDAAKLRIRKAEGIVFESLRAKVEDNLTRLRRNVSILDELDVACSSATVAQERNLVRPIVDSSQEHHIIGGRHPTVDLGLTASGRQFTSNDCAVGSAGTSIYLITGPNMGGKSTYLRQNALITILAQTGLYVPATHARIGLVDKIFSRIGSADNLYQDQSTFMVEMLETADVLNGATEKSFVIMDEVGRGTTPEDGVAVGYAVLKHLHNVNRCRTLFATHFHDLADMTAEFPGFERWCTDIEETHVDEKTQCSEWTYMHKLQRGVNRKSHALKVCAMAGMPEEAIAVAGEVLEGLQVHRQGIGDREREQPRLALSHG